jgi:hypothetical protein
MRGKSPGLLGVLVLAGLAACGGGGSPDQFDASPPDSDPTCGEWTVAPAASTDLRAFDPAPIALGRTTRIAFDVALTACEDLAMVRVEVSVDDQEFTIDAQVLRQIGGTCSGTARTVTRVVDLVPPTSGAWNVVVVGGDTLQLSVGSAPAVDCDPTRDPCATDCDCAGGERCIGVTQGGPTTVCARICEVDRDCDGTGRCTGDAPGGLPYTCDTQPECDAGTPCPDGFACTAGACAPTFTLSQTTRHECLCDADCDAGLRCVRPYDAGDPNRCQAMCPTDGSWCEGPHVCGALGFDVSGLAGTDAVCGWIGE